MNDIWLAHHGILGQKWGIRRYENEDGTLTEAGKERYYQDRRDDDQEAKAKQSRKRMRNAILLGTTLASASVMKSMLAAGFKDQAVRFMSQGQRRYSAIADIPKAVIKAGRAFVVGGAVGYGYTAFKQDHNLYKKK